MGSVFTDTSGWSRFWLETQLKYLKATTLVEFDHISILQEGDADSFSTESEVSLSSLRGSGSVAHMHGLKQLKSQFLRRQEKYDNFLFLDMDAFPIRRNWLSLLNDRLAGRWDMATILRPENLEQRLHSSVIFCRIKALEKLDWEIGEVGKDLAGGTENDLKILHYQDELRDRVFPLLKSNKHLVHPLLCSVYWDMFYHHSCGSGRKFKMRSSSYWGHMMPKELTPPAAFFKEIKADTNGFIKKLTGWHEHIDV